MAALISKKNIFTNSNRYLQEIWRMARWCPFQNWVLHWSIYWDPKNANKWVKTAPKSNKHYTSRNLTKRDATKKDATKKVATKKDARKKDAMKKMQGTEVQRAHCGANLRPKGAILVFSYASSLNSTPVSDWVSRWAEFRTSVASRLASLLLSQWH